MTSSKPQNPWRTVPDPPPSTKSRFLEDFARWDLDVREIYFTYPSRPGVGSSLIHPVHKYRTYLHEMAGAARCSQHRASCVQCAKGTVCVFDVGSGEIIFSEGEGKQRAQRQGTGASERQASSNVFILPPIRTNLASLPTLQQPSLPRDRNRPLNCHGEPAHEIGQLAELGKPTHLQAK